MVLLRNEQEVLPIPKTVRSVAVIGADAVDARLGGYSSAGIARVSILDGIRQKLGAQVEVRHAPGPGREIRATVVVPAGALSSTSGGRTVPGLTGEYFDNNRLEGQPRLVRTDTRMDFRWTLNSPGRGIAFDWYSVRWTGRLTIPKEGVRRIGIEGNDGYRLSIDSTPVIDNWRKQSYGTRLAEVTLAPGSSHDIRLEYFESTGNARVKLVWDAGVRDDGPQAIEAAVALARTSEVSIVVAGVEEGEFRDRALLGLPGRQEELIQAVAATRRPIVVVLIGGSAITMSRWIDRVAAVDDVWYPGEQGGTPLPTCFGDAGGPAADYVSMSGQPPLSTTTSRPGAATIM